MANKKAEIFPAEKYFGETLPKTVKPVQTISAPKQNMDRQMPEQNPAKTVQTTENGPSAQPEKAASNAPADLNQEAYTNEELAQKLTEAGIDPVLLHEYSQKGSYTQDRDAALTGGGAGEPADNFYEDGTWYYYEGTPRDVKEGTSGADEEFLSDGSYAYIQYCKERYANAESGDEKAYWHNEAEKVRARANYSGGVDGSQYIPTSQSDGNGDSGGYAGDSVQNDYREDTPEARMRALMDAWQEAAMVQNSNSVEYAVQKAIKEYERTLEDAQAQFKEQAESTAYDARQAMDNTALYAQLRGDQGGIGREQYSSVQNTAAQNQQAIRAAQTKLATDTARQIEDLRVQGEFEKADAALEITQEYLARLMELERWGAEYDLSQQEFHAALAQWEAEFELDRQQLQLSQERWQTELDYEKYLNDLKLTGSGGGGSESSEPMTAAQVYRAIYTAGLTDADRAAVKAYLMSNGMDADLAGAYANAYVSGEYDRLNWLGYGNWGEGWSSEEWAECLEIAESYLKTKKYNGFNAINLGEILSNATREQWEEMYDLLARYRFAPFERSGE